MSDGYTTFAGNRVSDFEAFHDAAEGGNTKTLQVTLRTASRLLVSIAPVPPLDEEGKLPADYLERAQDGELLLARYIWDTDAGQTSSATGLIGTTISYQKDPAVLGIVSSSMGPYAPTEEEEVGDSDDGIAYVGRSPF